MQQLKRHLDFTAIFFVSILVFSLISLSEGSARGDVYTEAANAKPKVIAVQHKDYSLDDEITLNLSYLPIDSFNRYLAVGGSYTHYYTNYLGWEVLNIADSFNSSTGLQSYLTQQYNASTEPFNTLNYYFSSSVVYTPFYTKNLFLNSNVFYGDVSFIAGLGIAKFDSGFINSTDLGLMLRFFLGPASSIRFDIRNYLYFSQGVKTNIAMTIGYSYNFGEKAKVETKNETDE